MLVEKAHTILESPKSENWALSTKAWTHHYNHFAGEWPLGISSQQRIRGSFVGLIRLACRGTSRHEMQTVAKQSNTRLLANKSRTTGGEFMAEICLFASRRQRGQMNVCIKDLANMCTVYLSNTPRVEDISDVWTYPAWFVSPAQELLKCWPIEWALGIFCVWTWGFSRIWLKRFHP